MRFSRWILLLWAASLLAGPGPRVGAARAQAADDDRPIVVGTGNQVSGRLEVEWIGPNAAPFATAVEHVAAMAAPRGLTVALTRHERMERVPSAPLFAAAWTSVRDNPAALVQYLLVTRGFLVLFGDVDAIRPTFAPGRIEASGADARRGVDGDSGSALDAAVTFRDEEFGEPTVLVLPETAECPDAVALACVRHAIARAGGVRHLPTAFGEVTAREEAGRVVVEAPTLLDGKVTMDAVTLEGKVVIPPGPVGAIDRAALTDPENTVLRLHFEGQGVTDDLRVRLAGVVTTTIDLVEVEGFQCTWAGDPAAFRVVVTARGGVPVPDATVSASLDASIGPMALAGATTDAGGTAFLTFPARAMDPPGSRELVVSVRNAWGERTLKTTVDVAARATRALQTDRTVYRPGDLLRGRVLALGAGGRPAAGERVAAQIRDSRGRVVRTFSAVTDDFGVAPFEMPLASSAARGEYEILTDDGSASARTTFRVEDPADEPFEVRFDLAAPATPPDGRVRGAVIVRNWDGTDVEDVVAHLSFADGAPVELRGAGRLAFDVVPPPAAAGAETLELRAVVEHRGAIATATTRLPAPPRASGATTPPTLAVEAPTTSRAGAQLAVRVSSAEDGALVDVALAGPTRFLAAATVVVKDGAARVELAVPGDAAGPALVTARVRRGDAVAKCETSIASLAVEVGAPASAAPGDDVTAAVRVRDTDGHDVPALLDVRGFDAAYAAEAGRNSLDPRTAGETDAAVLETLLHSESWEVADEDAFLARVAESARAALAEAARTVLREDAPPVEMPWGGRIYAGDRWAIRVVCGYSPATWSNGHSSYSAPMELTLPLPASVHVPGPAELLHPPMATRDVGERTEFLPHSWGARHQAPDGSWDPATFTHACRPSGSCAEPGPAGFRIAGTALVLLGYLGAGETHQSGVAKATVRRGLTWLLGQQAEDGFVGDRTAPGAVLNHAFATLALTEAWGMTQSRLFESGARRSVAALVALQRPDGGFSEAGARRGSVIAGTIAMMAVKSARMSGIELPEEITTRHLAWMEANADPELHAPLLSDEEMSVYPFGRSHARRTAAAAAFLLRVFAGQSPETTPGLEALVVAACADLPQWDAEKGGIGDPFSSWLTTLAAWQIGHAPWKRWTEALKMAVVDHQDLAKSCNRGSWSDCGGPAGRLLATAFHTLTIEVYYRYGRVFGIADEHGGAAPRVRAWFPDLCVSDLGLRTDGAGRRDVPFRVPDQITTWRLDVGAWDREGRYGRGTTDLVATLPVVVTAGLPRHLARGDVVRVPVPIRSTLDEDADCTVVLSRHDGLDVIEAPAATVRVPARSTVTTFATVRVTAPDHVVLGVTVTGGGRSDAFEAAAEVAAPASAAIAAARVTPGEAVRVPVTGDGGRARLRIYTSPLGAARSSIEGLLSRPTGCFEQTCATLYPAVLAGRWLALPETDPRTSFLREGAQRLLGFEAEGGGFSLFEHGAARADLTALGIHVLLDLEPVAPPDRGVLDRAGEFLAGSLPKDGPERILALGALRRLGRGSLPALPDLGDDPYLIALALTQNLLEGDAASAATTRLAAAADTRVVGTAVWHSGSRGLFSFAPASDGETTAVVVEALAKSRDNDHLIRGGFETVRRGLGPDGAWRTTRETVAALRALLVARPASASGHIVAKIPGRPNVTATLVGDVVDVDLGPWSAGDELTLGGEGTGKPWGVLIVHGAQADAGAAAHDPAMTLSVSWPKTPLRLGEVVAVPVTLATTGDADVNAPIAVIPLPGGLTVDRRALARAAAAAGFDHAEIADGAVRLYASRLARGASLTVTLPCVARTAGTYSAGGATSYPYYEPERAASAASATVEIVAR